MSITTVLEQADELRVSPTSAATVSRVSADGKFLSVGPDRFLVKGVTYGTFAPGPQRTYFPDRQRIAGDFAMMRTAGINTVRVYTPPPDELLDEAAASGLRVMIGLPWSQHVAFLDSAAEARGIRQEIRRQVRRFAKHPACLMIALGNEIPAPVVRWHGRAAIERFVRCLYDDAKAAAPETLFTYVNYPPTEYLELPFLDVCAFNVYLHDERNLRAYVARLQHIAGHKPLLLAEAGADSHREGGEGQARLTAMQLGHAFAEGACGAIAFAWTDEWWRGGFTVEDWAFGLVTADRQPKPALAAVERVFGDAPFPATERGTWPKITVAICAYNAAETIDECLASIERLDYPDYDVVVVNDGSHDDTAERARRYPRARVIDVPNGGLSAARNIAASHATGEIVAYTDADVRVDRDWLTYLVQPFITSDVVAVGGPNIAPRDDPWVAQCVARGPGGPTHVMLDDRIAEHVPGCNMAIRREALLAVNGFNPIYLRAGDDVDMCWRLQARGWKIGFAPAAVVWHHHRTTVGAYWRQQVGYGEGEAWLRPHHPDKFVGARAVWRGRIYSPLPFVRSLTATRIDAGTWGTAAFPSIYHPRAHPLKVMPYSPAWLITSLALTAVGGTAVVLWPAYVAAALAGAGLLGLVATVTICFLFALRSEISTLPPIDGLSPGTSRWLYRVTIAWLHFSQPFARLRGRIRGRFTSPGEAEHHPVAHLLQDDVAVSFSDLARALQAVSGRVVEDCYWGENWATGDVLLSRLASYLGRSQSPRLIQVDDGWTQERDISLRVGGWAWLDLRMIVEDHGSGRRLARVVLVLRSTWSGLASTILPGAALVAAASIGLRLGEPGAAAAGTVVMALIALACTIQTAQTIAFLRRSVSEVVATLGMERVPPEARDSRIGVPLEPAEGKPLDGQA